jgi:hypothetical protein
LNFTDLDWVRSFLIGAAFIAIVARARLAGHGTDRSFTTFGRYLLASSYYALGQLALYALLMCGVWFLTTRWPNAVLAYMTRKPAWVALLTVAVVVRLPLIAALDRVFRRHARRLGGVPDEMQRLRDAISAAPRSVSQEKFRELHFRLLRRGIDLGNRKALPDHSLHSLFQQVAELKCILERCEQDPRFAGFMRDNADSLHDLARSFDRVMFRSSRSAEAMGRLHEFADQRSARSGSWESLGAMVENQTYCEGANGLDPVIATSKMLLANQRDDMRCFVNDAATLLARLALVSRASEASRIRLLSSVGLKLAPARRPRFRALFAVFAVVFFAMLAAVAYAGAGDSTLGQIGLLTLMVSIFFVVAILCAVYPKQYFAFANVDVYGRQPYLFYVVTGLAATVLPFAIGLMFRLAMRKDAMEALTESYHKTPWLLLELVLAVAIAVLIQDKFDAAGRRKARGRSFDALVVGGALGVTMGVIQVLLPLIQADFQRQLWTVGFMAAIGAFIGYYVPARFRTDFGQADRGSAARVLPRDATTPTPALESPAIG